MYYMEKINKQEYQMDNNANLYGDINFNFLGLTPDTSYLFKAVVETTNSKRK